MEKSTNGKNVDSGKGGYEEVLAEVVSLLEEARRSAARSVNAIMTATYWEIGRRIVEYEQGGAARAIYGRKLLRKLSADLKAGFGRGFSVDNQELMRLFYLTYPQTSKFDKATPGSEISETTSRKLNIMELTSRFQLSWSHYVTFIRSVKSARTRAFYESETLSNGWSVRQLNRQIESQFYERTALSRNKKAMLEQGSARSAEDKTTPEDEIKDPFVLEFLDLKDEYSESDLEAALIRHIESFLMELGGDFAFVGRQRRLRVGDEWFRVDLLFFHRRLRCLVIIDLKLGKFTPADAGQMHFYLNYARENWTNADENPPVGLILCAGKSDAAARYALGGLPNKVVAAEYMTTLPDEKTLVSEINHARSNLDLVRRRAGR